MPFRRIQKLSIAKPGPVFELEQVEHNNGNITMEAVDQCEKKLPSAEMFDLGNMLEAGVDLDEVNSKVMSQKTVNAENVVRKYTKKENNESSDNN